MSRCQFHYGYALDRLSTASVIGGWHVHVHGHVHDVMGKVVQVPTGYVLVQQ